ncbi:MAG: FG-GAP-like repeat-containing protein [Kofleriaceae bacterium]
MRCSVVVAASWLWAGALGCGGGVTLAIDGDLAVPAELDAICVGVGDRDLAGGAFGRHYRLTDRLASLPQTLAVEPGSASAALAWAQGYRGGAVVAQASGALDFGADKTLRLDRCPGATAGALVTSAPVAAPAGRVVASMGPGGTVAIALDATGAVVLDVAGGALVAAAAPIAGGDAVVAADLDGDCADDLAVARAGVVELWWRRGTTFTPGPVLATAAAAVAAGDLDYDGDLDLVIGAGATITVWRNDGAGGFAPAGGAVDTRSAVTAVTALAIGDLDGDGHADLVVGQAGAPLVALLGDPAGAGILTANAAVFSAAPRTVGALALGDLDGDGDKDVVATVAGAGPRVYLNRAGLLEDQTFVRLPPLGPTTAVAIGDWDGDCLPDLVTAGQPSQALRGAGDASQLDDGTLGPASAVVGADLDDDGAADRVLIGPDGARWVHR